MLLSHHAAPRQPVDTLRDRALVEAITRETWILYGRHGPMDWAGVDRHLARLAEQARSVARDLASSARLEDLTGLFPP